MLPLVAAGGLRQSEFRAASYLPCQDLSISLRIPVKWSGDSGDVGQYRSEATLVDFYLSEVDHMSQEVGEVRVKL